MQDTGKVVIEIQIDIDILMYRSNCIKCERSDK
jgi:hypothetical protein